MELEQKTPAIVFDLGGVLFDTDTRTIVPRACKLLQEPISADEVNNFFRELAQIKPIKQHAIKARNEDGQKYPPLLNDFLSGVPSKQILEHISHHVDTNSRFWRLAQSIFNPKVLAELYVIIPEGEQFAAFCAEKEYKLYILSNWDVDSFPLVRKKHKKLFDLFSGILISGECNLIKPDPAIYKLLLQKYCLKPGHCFVVDNQQENLNVARSLGMHDIMCPEGNCGPNFDKVRVLLEERLAESKF